MATPVCLTLLCRYLQVGENVSMQSGSHISQAFAELVHVHQLWATLKRIRWGAGRDGRVISTSLQIFCFPKCLVNGQKRERVVKNRACLLEISDNQRLFILCFPWNEARRRKRDDLGKSHCPPPRLVCSQGRGMPQAWNEAPWALLSTSQAMHFAFHILLRSYRTA